LKLRAELIERLNALRGDRSIDEIIHAAVVEYLDRPTDEPDTRGTVGIRAQVLPELARYLRREAWRKRRSVSHIMDRILADRYNRGIAIRLHMWDVANPMPERGVNEQPPLGAEPV
jgi:hypothetical protein